MNTENREISIKRLGKTTLILRWSGEINRSLLVQILTTMRQIEKEYKRRVELIKTYNELTLFFTNEKDAEEFDLTKIMGNEINSCITTKTIHIPVRYETNTTDFNLVKDTTGLSKEEIIELHSKALYDVHFIGFLPGFMYLGGLDQRLEVPRKSSPGMIKKGDVAIAGSQTGIYPSDSPGGWHVIATTTEDIFSITNDPPIMVQAGDYIKFEPI